ncbi:MAG TPA: hypothetical protein PLC15_19720, partial [Candidatus Obscuribacter sp.]|nr:hypothetical protein [Candidatus Obscuribacter sp.]
AENISKSLKFADLNPLALSRSTGLPPTGHFNKSLTDNGLVSVFHRGLTDILEGSLAPPRLDLTRHDRIDLTDIG